jgi:hypothetical protein
VDPGGRRRSANDAGFARLSRARVRLRPANGLPDTKIGTFSDALMDETKKKGWVVISMKNDWKRIFDFEK